MPTKNKKQQQQSQNKKKKSKQGGRGNAAVRAPTSLSVRRTTPSSGALQTIQLFEVGKGLKHCDILPANLPWLKGVAPSFQSWKMENVKVWYEPRVSTATNGMIALGFIKDFMDGTPQSLSSLILSAGSTRSAVWDQCQITVPPGPPKEYCSLSNFNDLSPEDKNGRALGRIFTYCDIDTDFVAGRVFMSYTPVLTGPIDPDMQA